MPTIIPFSTWCSPSSKKLFHKEIENIFTLGKGSYLVKAVIPFYDNKPQNILVGHFSSLAEEIIFPMGGNHPLKSVSTSPLDTKSIIKSIFKDIHLNFNPLSNVRRNPRQVIIGNDVWIGRGVTIMGGVKIGNGAVIGANTVVAKDIPPYAIAVGNPARVIKYRFNEETIRKFLAVKWWNWSLEKIADNFPFMNDPKKFLDVHYSPKLEEFPEDDFSRELSKLTGGGIYNFIPDFQATNPLWPKVIKEFTQAKLEGSVLVIWLGKDVTDENAKALSETIDDNKNILTFKHEENFSPTALRMGTHFITTREMSTLEALDYLWNTDVKIISALDDGIFKSTSATLTKDTKLITNDDMLNFGDLNYLWNQ